MNRLKSRLKKIEEGIKPEETFVVLQGDSKTDFKEKASRHIEETGCPANTVFVNVINRFEPEQS